VHDGARDADLLKAVQQRLDANAEAMRQRRETVEHPFGTMKARMGATHFLTKTLPKVAAEMALSILAYTGHEHRRDQAADRRDRGLKDARFLLVRTDIRKTVLTRPGSGAANLFACTARWCPYLNFFDSVRAALAIFISRWMK
jgi:hypothetical protein